MVVGHCFTQICCFWAMRHVGPKQFFLVSKSSKKWPNHLDWWNYGETYLLQSTKWIEIRLSMKYCKRFCVSPWPYWTHSQPFWSELLSSHRFCLTLNSKVLECQTERQAVQTDTFLFINGTMCNKYHYYCWWKKSCTSWYGSLSQMFIGFIPPGMYETLWHNGIYFKPYQLVFAGFQPSTTYPFDFFGSSPTFRKGGAPFLRRGTRQAEPRRGGWSTKKSRISSPNIIGRISYHLGDDIGDERKNMIYRGK